MSGTTAGNTADLALALQPAKGAAALEAQHRVYLTGGGAAPEREMRDIEETAGSRQRSTSYVSQVRAAGSPQFAVRPNFIGLLLLAGFGAKETTGSGPYQHVYGFADEQPWLTAWRMLQNKQFEKFRDVKVGALNFSSEAGDLLRVTAEMVGLVPSYLANHDQAANASVEITDAFVHHDGEGQLAIEGTPVSSLDQIGVNLNFGHTPRQGDAITLDNIYEGMIEATITTRQVVRDFALFNRFHYGSATPDPGATPTRDVLQLGAGGLSFKYERPGSPERSLAFLTNRVQVQSIAGVEPNTSGEPLDMTVTYKVYEAENSLTATLVNGVADYPAAEAEGS